MTMKRAIVGGIAALLLAGTSVGYQENAQNGPDAETTRPAIEYIVTVEKPATTPSITETDLKAARQAGYGEGYAAGRDEGFQAGKNDGYSAGFCDGEQAVINGMIIETDGDCDSALIYYNGDCYLHGANGFPIDVDEPLTASYLID